MDPDLIRQALARGYCHPDNSSKELDARLIEAMAIEVMKVLRPMDLPQKPLVDESIR